MAPIIHNTGFSVVSPETGEPHLVDIIIVHGLQGHPQKTWQYEALATSQSRQTPSSSPGSRRSRWKSAFGRKKSNEKEQQPQASNSVEPAKSSTHKVYWPTDLLSADCPQARVMVWGYDTMVTRGGGQAANKTGLFAHGQNLLYALSREREHRRPTIFVAHSLGGILVKEMLSLADASKEIEFLNIIEDTSAVVFLGTPHRGSDMARIGDIARRIASALRIDTSPMILDSLGLRNDDLSRSQHSSARIWDERRFNVKTFQESKGVSGVNIGMLNELIVPPESSSLGHPREHAETLDADHMNMCKFTGAEDPNYRKFGAELRDLYRRASQANDNGKTGKPVSSIRSAQRPKPDVVLSDATIHKAHMSLKPANIGLRERTIEQPAPGTCDWPLEHRSYRTWLTRNNTNSGHGLLWLTGNLGSGKSVLVKYLANTCAAQANCPDTHVATFFFDARGASSDQKSMKGLLRALLFQLLPLCPKTLDHLRAVHDLKTDTSSNLNTAVEWELGELQEMLIRICREPRATPFFLFIDGVDECEELEESSDSAARAVVLFLTSLTRTMEGEQCTLNICISSRRHVTVSTRGYTEITIDRVNHGDIGRYVHFELTRWQMASATSTAIESEIVARAGGIFLWARLVLGLVTKAMDSGFRPTVSLLQEIPDKLEEVFDQVLHRIPSGEQEKSLRLFQWVLFTQRPLSADEWYHVLAFIDEPDLQSLQEWSWSRYCIESVEQLQKRVRAMSGGLLEVTTYHMSQHGTRNPSCHNTRSLHLGSEGSVIAGAGSLEATSLEFPAVHFIHESVRLYFLTGNAFRLLGQIGPGTCAGAGHMYILDTCLRYLGLDEWSRILPKGPPTVASVRSMSSFGGSGSRVSIASFGSSAASSVRRLIPSHQDISQLLTHTGNNSGLLFEKCSMTNDSSDYPPGLTIASDMNIASAECINGDFGSADAMRTSHLVPSMESHKIEQTVPTATRGYFLGRTPPLLRQWLNDNTVLNMSAPSSTSISGQARSVPDSEAHLGGLDAWQDKSMTFSRYPLLRYYVIDMMYHHAVAADTNGADPSHLLERIEQKRTLDPAHHPWRTWCRLNDDVPSDTTLAYFAAEWNLSSWIRWYAASQPDVLNHSGGALRFPLLVAWRRGHDELVSSMLPHINPDTPDRKEWTVLHHLANRNGGEDLLARLREVSVDQTFERSFYQRNNAEGYAAPDLLLERVAHDLHLRLLRESVESPNWLLDHIEAVVSADSRTCSFDEDKERHKTSHDETTRSEAEAKSCKLWSRVRRMPSFEASNFLGSFEIPMKAIELLAGQGRHYSIHEAISDVFNIALSDLPWKG